MTRQHWQFSSRACNRHNAIDQPTSNRFQTSLGILKGEILMLRLKFVNVVWFYEHNFEVMRKLFDLEFCYKYNMI
jgi:hypothetical protein